MDLANAFYEIAILIVINIADVIQSFATGYTDVKITVRRELRGVV
jgi:hypothetical protein